VITSSSRLVVRDQQGGVVGGASGLTPPATIRGHRCRGRNRFSIENRHTAPAEPSVRISLRFFSPPEKPFVDAALQNEGVHPCTTSSRSRTRSSKANGVKVSLASLAAAGIGGHPPEIRDCLRRNLKWDTGNQGNRTGPGAAGIRDTTHTHTSKHIHQQSIGAQGIAEDAEAPR